MNPKVNYTVVGLFVLVMTFAVLAVGFWMSTSGSQEKYDIYQINVQEGVTGLSVQAPVELNGVKVGFVSEINLDRQNLKLVHVIVKVKQGTPITESTIATLQSQGITGLTYVGLKSETAYAPLLKAESGQPYPVIRSKPSLLVQLDTALREITDNINRVSQNVNQFMNKKNVKAFSSALANIDRVSQTLADNSQRIDDTLSSAQKLLVNSEIASRKFPDIADRLQVALQDVQIMSKQLDKTGRTATNTLNTFSQEAMPNVITLANRLKAVATNLQGITQEMKRNPSILVRGKLPAPKGPGE